MALQVGELYALLTVKDGQFNSKMAESRAKLTALGSSIDSVDRQTNKLGNTLENSAKKARDFGNDYEDVLHGIRMAGLLATAGLAIGFGAAAYFGVKANSDTEQFLATMTRLTGSTEKAKQELQKLKEFAKSTPFEMADLKQGELIMRAVGLETDRWRETIGDTAAAWKSAGKSYMDVVQAIADAQTGELERLKEFGITKQQIIDHGNKIMRGKELVNNKGQITDTKAFNTVLLDLMKQRYGGMMKVQSQTFSGMMSNIKDFATGALEVLSKPLFDRLNAGAKSAMSSLENLQNSGTLDVWAESIGQNIDGIIEFFKSINWEVVGIAGKFTAGALAAAGFAWAIKGISTAFVGLFASMGPIGWAMTMLSLFAGAVYATSEETERLSLAQIKQYEAGLKQTYANDELISSFESLRNRTKWTNDEFLHYLDLQTKLAKETDPNMIKKYKDEMTALQHKSGLTNDEITELLRLNTEMIKQLPNGSQKISEQGNAVVTLADQYRKLNEEKRKEFVMNLEGQKNLLLAEQPKLIDTITKKTKEANAANKEAVDIGKMIEKNARTISQLETQIAEAKRNGNDVEAKLLENKLRSMKVTQHQLGEELAGQIKIREEAQKQITAAQGKLDRLKEIDKQLGNIKLSEAQSTQQNKQNSVVIKDKNNALNSTLNITKGIRDRLQQSGNETRNNIGLANSWNGALGKSVTKTVTVNQRITGGAAGVATLKRHSGGTIMRVPGIGGDVPALLKGGETILTQRHTNDLIRILERGGGAKGTNNPNMSVTVNNYDTKGAGEDDAFRAWIRGLRSIGYNFS